MNILIKITTLLSKIYENKYFNIITFLFAILWFRFENS